MIGYHDQILGAHHKVISAAQALRLPPPPMTAVSVDAPLPDRILDGEFEAVLLDAGQPQRALSLYAASGGVDDRTSLVRSDTAVSYPDFIASVNAEFTDLRGRIAALEATMMAHITDPNAHRKVARAAEAVLGASARLGDVAARSTIQARLPPESASKIMPWCCGDHVCVTLCFPSIDGGVRYLTGTTPIASEAARLAQYVDASGVAPVDVLGGAGHLCNVLGAGRVISTVCAGAPDVLVLDESMRASSWNGPVLARVQPALRPSARAILVLASCCADGDEDAMAEWDAVGDAAERLGASNVVSAMNDAAEAVR
ncbi:MAG: hypothetical protein AAB426_02955 [Myxococcota bacterium]